MDFVTENPPCDVGDDDCVNSFFDRFFPVDDGWNDDDLDGDDSWDGWDLDLDDGWDGKGWRADGGDGPQCDYADWDCVEAFAKDPANVDKLPCDLEGDEDCWS